MMIRGRPVFSTFHHFVPRGANNALQKTLNIMTFCITMGKRDSIIIFNVNVESCYE
jgi:hypothetical protein